MTNLRFYFFIFPFLCFVLAVNGLLSSPAEAVVHLEKKPAAEYHETLESPQTSISLSGRILADYRTQSDGFLALEDTMGKIHLVKKNEIQAMTEDEHPFISLNKKEVTANLQKEFGPTFDLLATEHFHFVYNTSEGYVSWCGKLFESLYDAFEKYRSLRGFTLPHPDVPLVAVVFSNKDEFLRYVAKDAPGVENIVAYYHRMTNRIVLYDLSEVESSVPPDKRRSRTYKQVDEILTRPQAAYNVATIVHEATHQIAFNRKMILRTGPFPLWLAEGLAMAFESPDENSSKGWSYRGSGNPNRYRLTILKHYLAQEGIKAPFEQIILEEEYYKNIQFSYALSWGLYYYLDKKAPQKLVSYIEFLNQKIPFTVYSAEERLSDFEKFFGNDWSQFYKNYLRLIQSIR